MAHSAPGPTFLPGHSPPPPELSLCRPEPVPRTLGRAAHGPGQAALPCYLTEGQDRGSNVRLFYCQDISQTQCSWDKGVAPAIYPCIFGNGELV